LAGEPRAHHRKRPPPRSSGRFGIVSAKAGGRFCPTALSASNRNTAVFNPRGRTAADTAPPPLHPSRRSRLGCADEGTASRPAHRSRRKCRAVRQPRRRPPKSARSSPDRKHRSCTHAIAAGQWPPPNFPQESGNPETVSVASPGFRGQPFVRGPARVKESAFYRIEEARDHNIRNGSPKAEVAQVRRRFVSVQAGDHREGIIVEHASSLAPLGLGIGVRNHVPQCGAGALAGRRWFRAVPSSESSRSSERKAKCRASGRSSTLAASRYADTHIAFQPT